MNRWQQWRWTRQERKAVLVTALLDHLGPLTFSGLWRYIRGSSGSLYLVLERLEQSGRIEADWLAGPYPRRRLYRLRNRS